MNRAIEIFKAHNGTLKTSQAAASGIAPGALYAMRNAGLIRQISGGVYKLADMEPLGNPNLISVALRIPKAVICLISAPHFYGLTTQIPHKFYLALPQSAWLARYGEGFEAPHRRFQRGALKASRSCFTCNT